MKWISKILNKFRLRNFKELHNKKNIYLIPSYRCDKDLHHSIIKYFLKSNGVLRMGAGRATWINSDQLFLKDRFWMAKEGSYFYIVNYSDPYIQVSHKYKVVSYNDKYVQIIWVGQKMESVPRKLNFVQVPSNYKDYTVDYDSSIKLQDNSIYIGDLNVGDSISISLKL